MSEPICVFCTLLPPWRRGLCRTCHRKVLACGLPKPPRRRAGRPTQTLREWIARMPLAARRALKAALEEV